MKNTANTQTNQQGMNLQTNPKQSVNESWDVLLFGEVIGSVHGRSRLEAEQLISVWHMDGLSIAPSTFKA
jgi:hypothetical protein